MIYERNGTQVTEIKWVAPVQRTDGTQYGAADHAGYELGTSNADDPNDGFVPYIDVPAAYNITSWPLDQLGFNGEGTVEVALRTVDAGGRVSVWSDPLLFTVTLANPNPPAGFSAS